MRLVYVLLLSFGCVESSSLVCPDGLVCPQGSVCRVVTETERCAIPDQLTACEGKEALAGCDADDDRKRCHDGVCLDLCGDGRVDAGEVCDDGNILAGDDCSARCLDEVCGNGVIDLVRGEECDTGPAGVSGDGCSSTCQLEAPGWTDISPGIGLGPRTGPAFATDGAGILVFGGRDQTGYLAETWARSAGWSRLDPPRSPPGRERHTMAFDAKRGRYVLFGGFGVAGVLGDTWEFDGVTWIDRTPAVSPPPRFGTQMAYDRDLERIILVGGRTVETGVSDMWSWDGTTWTQLAGTGLPADPHMNVQLAYDVAAQELIYCGVGASGADATLSWSGTAWVDESAACPNANFHTNRMMYYPAASSLVVFVGGSTTAYQWSGSAWLAINALYTPMSARFEVGGVAVQDDIILFGGHGIDGRPLGGNPQRLRYTPGDASWRWILELYESAQPEPNYQGASAFDPYNGIAIQFGGAPYQTWLWSALRWEKAGALNEPSERQDAAMAFDLIRREAVMFGGNPGGGETWTFARNASMAWEWTQEVPASSPSDRRGAQMVFDAKHGQTILFGGNAGMTLLGDTWAWNGTTWARLATSGPPPRTRHAMVYDPARERIVLFGGYTSLTAPAADTWEWDGTTWVEVAPAGVLPFARAGATLTYDPLRGASVLLGGTSYPASSGTYDDWWEWDGATWTRIGSHGPIARSGHVAFYDPMRRGIVAFGGVKTALDLNAQNDETWILRYTSTDPRESCRLDEDGDGDGLAACSDPDCWGRCNPLCPPGASCPSDAPRCGDGTCSSIEDYLICPSASMAPAPACDG